MKGIWQYSQGYSIHLIGYDPEIGGMKGQVRRGLGERYEGTLFQCLCYVARHGCPLAIRHKKDFMAAMNRSQMSPVKKAIHDRFSIN
jgi:hypothetical protein